MGSEIFKRERRVNALSQVTPLFNSREGNKAFMTIICSAWLERALLSANSPSRYKNYCSYTNRVDFYLL